MGPFICSVMVCWFGWSVSPWWCAAIVGRPPCGLIISCPLTTAGSGRRFDAGGVRLPPPPRWLGLLSVLGRWLCCCWLFVFCWSRCGGLWLFCVLLCVALCLFWCCSRLHGEETAGCFAWFVFLVSHGGWVALSCGAMELSAVCDCGISWSYSLTFFNACNKSLTAKLLHQGYRYHKLQKSF